MYKIFDFSYNPIMNCKAKKLSWDLHIFIILNLELVTSGLINKEVFVVLYQEINK